MLLGQKAINIRCATAEKGIKLQPPKDFTLEMALEYIEDDELGRLLKKYSGLRGKTSHWKRT